MVNQLVRFVNVDDTEELLCECMHNACTLVYSLDYKLSPREHLAGLAEVLHDAGFKSRLMIADLVERNGLCNKQSHTSHYGCDQCIAESENLHWPADQIAKPRRDEQSWEVEVPESEGNEVNLFLGRKGPAPLKLLDDFQISTQLVVEPMHCLFLGITRHLIDTLIRSTRYHEGKPKAKDIERKIVEQYDLMRVPHEVQRLPRDFHQNWRSNEFKVFILCFGHRVGEMFYSAELETIGTIFSRFTFILRAMLLNNTWYERVKAKHNLNQEIARFCKDCEDLIGPLSANYHALTHLPYWRDRYRLHLLSAEPAEAFYGRNKKNIEERNRHYGLQVHYNSNTDLTSGMLINLQFAGLSLSKLYRF